MNSVPQSTHFKILSWNSIANSFATHASPKARASTQPVFSPVFDLYFYLGSARPHGKVRDTTRKVESFAGRNTSGPAPIKKLRPELRLWPGGPEILLLFFACFLAAAFACQRFFHPPFLAGFQMKGVTLHFLNDVLLLHFTLEATQGIFQRLAFL